MPKGSNTVKLSCNNGTRIEVNDTAMKDRKVLRTKYMPHKRSRQRVALTGSRLSANPWPKLRAAFAGQQNSSSPTNIPEEENAMMA